MGIVNYLCSRCSKDITSLVKAFPPDGQMTAGYYVASGWKNFTNFNELLVCDECMFKDPRYVAIYGTHSTT